MLARLRLADFAPLVGQPFALHVDGVGLLAFELAVAQRVGQDNGLEEGGKRLPFSLIFRGPRTPILCQRIYRLEHETMGALEIFIVPVGPDESGVLYEAVFS
jgi:hypothetical protein